MKREAGEQVYEIARQLIPIFGEQLVSLLYLPAPVYRRRFRHNPQPR
jgi:hypothetical protein